MLSYNVSYRDKDKSIQCIISYKDSDGKWKQKSKQGFKTQKGSKEWQSDTIKELEKIIKTPAEYRGMTFGEFKKIFVNDRKRQAANTVAIYEHAFMKFKNLNELPISEIGYINIKPCVDKMIDEKLTNLTIKTYLSNMRTFINHGIDKYQILESNPFNLKDYELPKERKVKKINALNEKELSDLLSKLTKCDYIISLIASKCGLRIGEIIGLKDTSFDFDKNEIKIDEQWKLIDKDKRIYGLGTLKSNNSYRTVPIPARYSPEIKEYIKGCVIGIDRRVFPEKKTASVGARLWRKYRKHGHEISVHDLRHTYATTLLLKGFDYKTVSELMGDTVQTIINTYSHFIDDMMESAKRRIDKIL